MAPPGLRLRSRARWAWSGCALVVLSCALSVGCGRRGSPATVAPSVELRIVKVGPGSVVSSPAGLRCLGDCQSLRVSLPVGALIRLSAEPERGARFIGFQGGCVADGDGQCWLSLREHVELTVVFSRDAAAPPAPMLESTTPASPSATREVRLHGRALPRGVVEGFANAGCQGAGTRARVDGAGAFVVALRVPEDAGTYLSARAFADDSPTAAASPCALLAAPFFHDARPPDRPRWRAAEPPSPSSATLTPLLTGESEAHALVRLHTTPTCEDVSGPSTLADAAGRFALRARVGANTASLLYATAQDAAGNRSACSSALRFVHDDIPPNAPRLQPTTTFSSDDPLARVSGNAEAGATLLIFTGRGCQGAPRTQTTAGGDGAFSVSVAVPPGSETAFSARALDAAGNVSRCSSTGPTFVFDQSPPSFAGAVSARALDVDRILVSWEPAEDLLSDAGEIFYELCYATRPAAQGGCRPFIPEVSTYPGATAWLIDGLSEDQRYYFVARARDRAGNRDANDVEVSARTFGRSAVRALTAGGGHTCAVLGNGTARCWGWNADGQLGIGRPNVVRQTHPAELVGLSGVAVLRAGQRHTCALLESGTAACWGSNDSGQLGLERVAGASAPERVTHVSDGTALAAGAFHTCVRTALGEVTCWGANERGQLGRGTTTERERPGAVRGLTSMVDVAAGAEHTCALSATGQVWCWGDNRVGQLGDGTFEARSAPGPVTNLDDAIGLAAGYLHTCALRATGAIQCWGSGALGQLGTGDRRTSALPSPVFDAESFVELTAGGLHTCGITASGRARCWGWNERGQVALHRSEELPDDARLAPEQAAGGVRGRGIVAGAEHTCLVGDDGRAHCWGGNRYGQLGDATLVDRDRDAEVPGLAGVIGGARLAAGGQHTCALRSNGDVSCWGANERGQCASDGPLVREPASVRGVPPAAAVAAGESHSCVLHHDGRVSCWGLNQSGQLGDGTTVQRPRPVEVVSLRGARSLVAGAFHTCALEGTGDVRCWGGNDAGQLGDATLVSRALPAAVRGVAPASALAAGTFHTCALVGGGRVRCWGANDAGQLGRGQLGGTNAPGDVQELEGALELVAGANHVCARTVSGRALCWGDNTFGQLGDGTRLRRASPSDVGLTGVLDLRAGRYHTCARLAGGDVRCWGWNESGQLGDGTFADRITPTRVAGLSGVRDLAAGQSHTCALLQEGSARCWGANAAGQLADGTTAATQTRPRAVLTFP